MRAKLTAVVILVLLAAFLTAGAGQAAPPEAGGAVHVVQWGENLAAIAWQYGTTVAAICQANGLGDPNLIYIGQRLMIPSGAGGMPPLPQQGATYTVRRGDNLTNIALRYGMPLEALMQMNNLPNGFIYAGQQLIVPGGPQGAMGEQQGPMPPRPQPRSSAGMSMLTVRPGDTLSALAYRYGITVNDLMQANNLYNPWIFSGQKLAVPNRASESFERPPGTAHMVQVGDTLAGLALRYGTTVQAILQANGLSQADFIVPGQNLVMPGLMRPQGNPGNGQMAVQGFKLGAPAGQPGGNPGVPQGMTGQAEAPLVGPGPESTNPNLLIAPIAPPGSSGYAQTAPLVSQSGPGPMPYDPGLPPGLAASPLTGELGQSVPVPMGPNPVAPPVITQKWVGKLLEMTQPEGNRYVGVLRVIAGGGAGMQVTVSRDEGNWSTTGFTGNKPEYGEGMAEFAPIGSGTFIISLDGQPGSNGQASAKLRLKILPHALTYVQFVQVPNGS